MKRLQILWTVGMVLILVSAAWSQVPITFQGVLRNDQGQLLSGTFSMTFKLYDAPTAGNLLWTETNPSVVVENGNLSVPLGLSTPLTPALFSNNPQVYLSIAVGSEELASRQRVGASPMALLALDAQGLGGQPVTTAGCADGQVLKYGTGGWSCSSVGPLLTAGNGIKIAGNTISLTDACAPGQILKWSGSQWACAADDNTGQAYTAGSGLQLDGTTFKIKQTCGTGEILRWNGSDWGCAADVVNLQSSTPGTPQTGHASISGTMTASKVHCNGGIFTADFAVQPLFVFKKISGYTANLCEWRDELDNVTASVSAGGAFGCNGLEANGNVTFTGVSGGTFRYINSDNTVRQRAYGGQLTFLQEWQNSAGTAVCWVDKDAKLNGDGSGLTGVSADKVRGVTVSAGCTSPSTGQIFKYNGTEWACAADDATSIGGIPFSCTAPLPGAVVRYDGASASWRCEPGSIICTEFSASGAVSCNGLTSTQTGAQSCATFQGSTGQTGNYWDCKNNVGTTMASCNSGGSIGCNGITAAGATTCNGTLTANNHCTLGDAAADNITCNGTYSGVGPHSWSGTCNYSNTCTFNGPVTCNAASTFNNTCTMNSGNAANRCAVFKGAAGQTAPLWECQNDAGTPVAWCDGGGVVRCNGVDAGVVATNMCNVAGPTVCNGGLTTSNFQCNTATVATDCNVSNDCTVGSQLCVGSGASCAGPNTVDVAGACHASSFPVSSDARFKENIQQLANVLAKLEKVRGVSFDWNETYEKLGRSTGHREIGVIAQEVEKEFPELVTTWGEENYRAVDYSRFSAVLVEAVKEQQKTIENLNDKLEKLEGLVQKLVDKKMAER